MAGGSIEFAVTFDRATGERLLAAERLVVSLPHLLRGLLETCDVGYRSPARFLAVRARLGARGYAPEARERLAFWCARAGGLAASLTAMDGAGRAAFLANLERCDLRARDVDPQQLYDAVGRIVSEAGAPADRPRSAQPRPVLAVDAGGPGWEGVEWRPESQGLFVPALVAPPQGDAIRLSVRIPGEERPVEIETRVAEVRRPDAAAPGAPAGFLLQLQSSPPILAKALGRYEARPDASQKRAAPRYPVKAPVKVTAPPAADPGARQATARIEYASDQELAADYLENLSHGGAFVRTPRPAAVGSRLTLEIQLPGGLELSAPSTVVFAGDQGMGVKFELDARGSEVLATAMARIAARPRRALVVDDDVLARGMLRDALAARGFEVLTAGDGAAGLQVIADEVLTLDLLVTDVSMPHMDGEALVRAVRGAGGETDLAIAVVTGDVDPELERRLEAAGADAVVDKALGAELVAQAADAALERKRLAAG